MSARAEHIRAKLRAADLTYVLLHGVPRALPAPRLPVPAPQEDVDARTEARDLCRNLGLDVDNEHWDDAAVSDFIRYAYAQGWKACETRLACRDVADGIAQAIGDPGSVLEQDAGESVARWSVRAVQQVCAYGVPK